MKYDEDSASYDGPCFLMRSLISSLSDGTLTGIRRWFIQRHLTDCPRCSEALATLIVIQSRLRALGLPRADVESANMIHLNSEFRATLFAKFDEIDRKIGVNVGELPQ